ncbi:MAG TPA: hypothetical protein VGI40_28685 [Pirellulaceae bacterium]
MQPSIWFEITKIFVTCGAGFLAGITVPITLRWLTRRFLGPKITVAFDADEVPAVAGSSSNPRVYFRAKIRNVKSHVARECRPYLTKIELVGSRGPIQSVLDETFQLGWSYDDKRDALDLPRGPHPTVDVAVYERDQPLFYPCLRGGGLPTKFNGIFSSIGTCRFTVLVTGHDVDPELLTFEVSYDGKNWPPAGKVV